VIEAGVSEVLDHTRQRRWVNVIARRP
jgi:hypothetical protein